jgi:hypothetical protein
MTTTRTKPPKRHNRNRPQRPVYVYTYTLTDALMAHPTNPLPEAQRVHQLTRMWQGLAAIETATEPTKDDWRVCSDAVNLMETLVHTMRVCTDASGLLSDAVTALAMAGKRHRAGGQIRLDGVGIQAVRAVLEDYAQLLDVLPHRTVINCHRLTERRMHQILAGKPQPHDVEVIDL